MTVIYVSATGVKHHGPSYDAVAARAVAMAAEAPALWRQAQAARKALEIRRIAYVASEHATMYGGELAEVESEMVWST